MPPSDHFFPARDDATVAERPALERIDRLVASAEIVINALPWLDGVGAKIGKLAAKLEEVVDADPDAAIAAVHLMHAHRYSAAHAVNMGILCYLTARRLKLPDSQRRSILCAALSCNASIQRLQDELKNQFDPPTPEQMKEMRAHPDKSVDFLRRTGVNDEVWLRIVAQHHERPDGCGYPGGLTTEAIGEDALMVGLADRYAACVSPYDDDRVASSASQGLGEVFRDPSYADFEALVASFIKELTLFPPGSFVRLDDDVEALVVRRTSDSMCPLVAVIGDDLEASPPALRSTLPSEIVESVSGHAIDPAYRRLW